MYKLIYTFQFSKKAQKLLKRGVFPINLFKKQLEFLKKDPFYPSLRTHKAEIKNFGMVYTCSINGEYRIAWDFGQSNEIVLLSIGGHKDIYQ